MLHILYLIDGLKRRFLILESELGLARMNNEDLDPTQR
jgi:hypothetical protein